MKLAIASLFPIGKTVVSVDRILTPMSGVMGTGSTAGARPLNQIAKG